LTVDPDVDSDPGLESDRNRFTDGFASQCRRVNKYETRNSTRTENVVSGRWLSALRCCDKFPFGGSLTVHRFGIIFVEFTLKLCKVNEWGKNRHFNDHTLLSRCPLHQPPHRIR